MPSAFRGLLESAIDLRNNQTVDYIYTLPLAVAVPCGRYTAPGVTSFPPITKSYIVCDEDADFKVSGITGTVIAITDKVGRRFEQGGGNASASLSPIPSPFLKVPFTVNRSDGFPQSGIKFRIYNQASMRYLIGSEGENAQAFADIRNHFAPGYKPGAFLAPVHFPYYMTRGSKLSLEFLNNDVLEQDGSLEQLYHFVKLSFVGRKMWTKV